MVRHQDNQYDTTKIYNEGKIDIYQSLQSKPVFDEIDFIISFIGDSRARSIFIGIYEISDCKNLTECPHPYLKKIGMWEEGEQYYYYSMKRTSYMEDLIDRLVIDWGRAIRTWHQKLEGNRLKDVIEIYPQGYYLTFPGYDELVLNYLDLTKIIKNPDANRQWHIMLQSVAGIYLIVDQTDGRQYVGSAYGKDGILGRWKIYVENGHGNNKILKGLPKSNHQNFHFSILRTLNKTLTKKEVIQYENRYKQKLGSRAYGLNAN